MHRRRHLPVRNILSPVFPMLRISLLELVWVPECSFLVPFWLTPEKIKQSLTFVSNVSNVSFS